MAVREIRQWGDPVLRTRCDEVTRFDDALAALCEDLLDSVALEGRAGLAANQIGVSLRVFSYDVDDRRGVVVNPRIVEASGEQAGDEGCLSLPGLWYPLARPDHVVVEGVDGEGTPIRLSGRGLLARCFAHEVDHLDGMLYVDRLTGDTRRTALRAARTLEAAPPAP